MERELKAGPLDGLEIYPLFDRPYFREFKPVCRFGFGGRLEYGREHLVWDDKLDQCLRADWRTMCAAREQEWERTASEFCAVGIMPRKN